METDNVKAGIECLKSGDWDRALAAFENAVPAFPTMDHQSVGNCLIGLAILYGATGEKAKALKSVVAATEHELSGSVRRFLEGLKSQIERPDRPVNSPFTIKGKNVDMFFFFAAQVFIQGAGSGQLDTDQIRKNALDSLKAGYLSGPHSDSEPAKKRWWKFWK